MTQVHEETGSHEGNGPHGKDREAYRGTWQQDWAPRIVEGTCSAPTSDAAKPGEMFYWKFIPTQTGYLSFDAIESFIDGPNDYPDEVPSVNLGVYQKVDDWWDEIDYAWQAVYENDPTNGGLDRWIDRGRLFMLVEKGVEYLIGLMADDSPGLFTPTNLVLRVDDRYVQESEWIQPPDQVIIWGGNPETAHITPTKTSDVSKGDPSTMNDLFRSFWIDEQGYGTSNPIYWKYGFIGQFRLSRTFAGPYPATDPDAILCSWRWSRVLSDGWDWWDDALPWDGPGGLGGDFGWMGGPGVCTTFGAGSYQSDQGYTDRPVGYTYSSDSPNQYQEIGFRCFATAQAFSVRATEHNLGKTGTLGGYPKYLPDIGEYDQIRWMARPEDPNDPRSGEEFLCKVLKVEVAADELNNGGAANGSDVKVEWYVESVTRDEDIYGRWGPRDAGEYTSAGLDYMRWVGGPGGPESWVGSQHHVTTYAGGAAGPWIEIPQAMWDNDTVRELDADYNHNHALRFAGVPDGIFSNSVPVCFH